MSEMGGSYDPGPWGGWDFKSARKAHKKKSVSAGRGYGASASVGGKKTVKDDVVPPNVSTDSPNPLVIVTDGTGSMGHFPETIFKKLPFLDRHGVDDYLPEAQISFAMIGDAAVDDYPLQVQPFGRGKNLEEALNNLIIEGGGGGNVVESYELAAGYYLNNCEIPKAIKPVMIFIGDEGYYANWTKERAKKFSKVNIEKAVPTKKLFKELSKKFSVYCIMKPYHAISGDTMDSTTQQIYDDWIKLLGADRVAILSQPERVVDVILGLLAHEVNMSAEFTKELEWRQDSDQVKTVKAAMVTIGKPSKKAKKGKKAKTGLSIMKRPDDDDVKMSRSLI